jgi:arginyl-tRNA synthetase
VLKKEIEKIINKAIKQWIKKEQLKIKNVPVFCVEFPPPNIAGDFSCNVALVMAKEIKSSPYALARKITMLIDTTNICNKVEIAGAGFINFFISPGRLYEELEAICKQGEMYGKENIGRQELIQIEFVSANPTGPLHIGHGRGAAIGDALANILTFIGYKVEKEYYVNNRGKQIEVLGCSVMLQYDKISGQQLDRKEKKYLEEKKSEDIYKGEYIEEIARKIFNDKKYNKIEKGRERGHWFFEKAAIEIIQGWIEQVLNDLGVKFNTWFQESKLYEKKGRQTQIDKVTTLLKKKGYLYDKDGAIWFASSKLGDEKDRVVVRKNNEPTYLASDIAYHYDKFVQRKFKKVINIWGADHHGYVARLKGVITALGYNPQDLKVILYQLVSLYRGGKQIAMSTRKGEFVTLREVINEVGPDVCRFFFLMRGANSSLDFDLEIAKKQSPENPVYYIQYAHARICSIFKEAEKKNYSCRKKNIQLELLKEPEELELMKKLAFYPDIVQLCARKLEPHHIVIYLQDLAKNFHSYYNKFRILSDDIALRQARLKLVKGIKKIISNGLNLLGVSVPEKM